jgi:hypothetical protein
MMNSQTARSATERTPQFTVIEGGNDPAALAETRARRARTRRRHEPPVLAIETRRRIGQWKDRIATAQKAGGPPDGPSARCHRYLHQLLAFASVRAGGFCYASDATMASEKYLNVETRTVQRHRDEAEEAGLIEVVRELGRSCQVRPILDCKPVFPGMEPAAQAGQNCRGTYDNSVGGTYDNSVGHSALEEESSEESLPPSFLTESLEMPPTTASEAGGGIFHDRVEEQAAEPVAEPAPAPPAAEQPQEDDRAPALAEPAPEPVSPLAGQPNEQAVAAWCAIDDSDEPTVADLDALAFQRLWWLCQPSHERWKKAFAHVEWLKLSPGDKTAIGRLLDRDGRVVLAPGCSVGAWIRMRNWEITLALPQLIEVHEGSRGWWQCCRRLAQLGKSSPITQRGSWYFPAEWLAELKPLELLLPLSAHEDCAERHALQIVIGAASAAKRLAHTNQGAPP